jgi:cation transport regulator ChaB
MFEHFLNKGVSKVPYSRVSDLPEPVKKLPAKAQQLWMDGFNRGWNKNHDETKAVQTAWNAVETSFERSGETWAAKISELPLFWSESTVDKLSAIGYNNHEQTGQTFLTNGFGKDPGYFWVSAGLLDNEVKPETLRSFPLEGRSGTYAIVGELVDPAEVDETVYHYGVVGLAYDRNTWSPSTIAASLEGTTFSDYFIDEGVAPASPVVATPSALEAPPVTEPTAQPAEVTPQPPSEDPGLATGAAGVEPSAPTAGTDTGIAKRGNILKMDTEERTMTSIVLEPDEIDAQGDMIDPDEIKKTQRAYMLKFPQGQAKIGYMHKDFSRSFDLLESYLAPVDFTLETPRGVEKVKKGSWICTVRVNDDQVWDQVKKGEITGFSIGGVGRRIPVE